MDYQHLVDRTIRMNADRVAVACDTTARTFAQVGERARRLGNALTAAGVTRGDAVLVLMSNCAEYVEVDIGLAYAALVRVSLNTRATARQQLEIMEDSGARVLIYGAEFEDMASEMLRTPSDVRVVIRLHGDSAASGIYDYEEMLAGASPTALESGPTPDDTYGLFYTSGTTGRSKGVVLTHAAYFAVALNLLLEFGPVWPGEKIILTQPLSHGGGFFMLPWFMSGATLIVMQRFDSAKCLDIAQRYEVETLKVVPAMLLRMLSEGIEVPDLPALRQVIYGASAMPAEQLGDLLAMFGPVLVQLYGQTEAPMSITVLTREDHAAGGRLLKSAGRPFRGVEVRVVDEAGRDVAPGDRGEVITRGPHIMSGYWNQPDLTATVLRDGYIYTRDIAEVDERGYLYIMGRTDEMIISGGFNIAPRVVEDVLNRHPAIFESAVIGLAHATLGQEVTAFVTLRPGFGAVSTGELVEFTRAELGYQRPRTLRIVPALPRNAYGKVVVDELVQMATVEGDDEQRRA